MSFGVTDAIKIVDELLTGLSPPIVEEEKYEEFRCQWSELHATELVKLLQSYVIGCSVKREVFEIFDVRDDTKDFKGGNIITATNIPHKVFRQNLGTIFNKFHSREIIVIHCMYSQQRGVKAANWYTRSLEELVNNYQNPNTKNKAPTYSSQYSSLKDVKLNDDVIKSLQRQNVFVLSGGFNHFLNEYYDYYTQLFENFNSNLWKHDASMWNNTKLVHIFDM